MKVHNREEITFLAPTDQLVDFVERIKIINFGVFISANLRLHASAA